MGRPARAAAALGSAGSPQLADAVVGVGVAAAPARAGCPWDVVARITVVMTAITATAAAARPMRVQRRRRWTRSAARRAASARARRASALVVRAAGGIGWDSWW